MWTVGGQDSMSSTAINNDFTRDLLESRGREVASKLREWTGLTPERSMAVLSALSPVVLGPLKRRQEKVGAKWN